MDSGKFSVTWCQSLGLEGVVGREGECSCLSNFEERRFVWEEILTLAVWGAEECLHEPSCRKERKESAVCD